MTIIEFEPQSWFFCSFETSFYIDVNCNHSFVSFSLLIKLNDEETVEYHKYGRDYLNTLATDIQYHSSSKYYARNISDEVSNLVHSTIMKFNQEKNFH
jgi:hypothetical protein